MRRPSSLWLHAFSARPVSLALVLAIKSGLAIAPEGISVRNFLGAACLCGIGDTVSLLMADQAFRHGATADVAKIGVLIGSVLAALASAAILALKQSIRRDHRDDSSST